MNKRLSLRRRDEHTRQHYTLTLTDGILRYSLSTFNKSLSPKDTENS